MDSESRGSGDHIAAIRHFDRDLDTLTDATTGDILKEITRRMLAATLDLEPFEASTLTRILDETRSLPRERELEEGPEVAAEMLKLGLFNELTESYIFLQGKEKFSEWIGPFIRSVLAGHTDKYSSYEHEEECPERFCPARVITCFVEERLPDDEEDFDDHWGYEQYADELVFMNVTIILELNRLGIYDDVDTDILLDNYQWWLESFEDPPAYDAELFKA